MFQFISTPFGLLVIAVMLAFMLVLGTVSIEDALRGRRP